MANEWWLNEEPGVPGDPRNNMPGQGGGVPPMSLDPRAQDQWGGDLGRHFDPSQFGTPTDDSGNWWSNLSDKNRLKVGAGLGKAAGGFLGGIVSLIRGQPDNLLKEYRRLRELYANLEDPTILKKIWASPIVQKIAEYKPELVRGMQESLEDIESYEGDAGLRAQEDEALARVTDRARRGDPTAQRIQTQQAMSRVGRAMGQAGATGMAAAQRRGMPGGMIGAPGLMQAGTDYASRVGAQNVLAARGDQAGAERAALAGATGIRQGREAQAERAMMIRNNFVNSMSNRNLAVQITNQKARQASSDRNQGLAQSLHRDNLLRADERRISNQKQRNLWERERYGMDRQRLQDDERFGTGIASEQDRRHRATTDAWGNVLEGAGEMAGTFIGMGGAGK